MSAALAVVALAGAAGSIWWVVTRQDEPIKPLTRRTSDFVVDWRCLACGHTTRENAGPGPKPCPECSKREMYVSIRWSCPEHGVQKVAFQYDEQGDPSQVKIGEEAWKPATVQGGEQDGASNIICPRCGQRMMPAEAPEPAR